MKNKIITILFLCILFGFSVINIMTPSNIFSNRENRYLQTFPKLNTNTLLGGKFGKEFEIYASDQFFHRDAWISMKTISDLAILKKDNGRIYFGSNSFLFDIDPIYNAKQMRLNVGALNSLFATIKQSSPHTLVNVLLVPTKSQIYTQLLPTFAPTLDEVLIQNELSEQLSANVITLNSIFKDDTQFNLYYKTDHHWTTYGAFLAYQQYMSVLNKHAYKLDDFSISEVSNTFLGTNYRKSNFYIGPMDQIFKFKPKQPTQYSILYNESTKSDTLYSDESLKKTDQYSYFLAGDHAIVEIETNSPSNDRILVIKDSFANSWIPFLTNHYKSITVIDPRYYRGDISQLIHDSQFDEVVVLFNSQNLVFDKNILSLDSK